MLPVLLGVVLLAPAVDPPKEKDLSAAAKKELAKLQGKWTVVKLTSTDRNITAGPNDRELFMEFKGRSVAFDDEQVAEVIDLDPGTTPKCLDFKLGKRAGEVPAGGVCESVYKLDGDTLTWAVHIGGNKMRPANFDDPKEAGTLVVVLKRVKE